MAKKIYIKGNYIFIDDEGVQIRRFPVSKTDFGKDDVNWRVTNRITNEQMLVAILDVANWYNEAGDTAFSEATLDTFLEDNTGNFNTPAVAGGEYAEFHLTTTPEVVAMNDDGVTWVKIPNMVLGLSKGGFTVTTGTLNKTEKSGVFYIVGTSDVTTNKAAVISYALVINGTVVPSEITVHTFAAADKQDNISINAIADIPVGATIEIHAKGDGTASLTITVAKLDMSFLRIDN